MAQTLAQEGDFDWLKNVEAQLRARARPRPKFARIVETRELVEAGLVLMQEARDAEYGPARQATSFRNGLIIALLALCPIRVGTFASLTLGRSFLRIGDGWWIGLAANETKNGRPDERPAPGFLTSCVDEYLSIYRPRFLCAGRAGRARGNQSQASARSSPPPLSPPSVGRKASSAGAISPRGSAWFPVSSPPAASRSCLASANEATATFADS